jgi:glycosyltransferase involved in cell wall biosynthesis
MTKPGLISVIVATHAWPEALAAVLRSLANQTDTRFEIVVAEDGADDRTRAVIKDSGLPVIHTQQQYIGFRAAAARNRGILACHGDYCIFLDGDCIPRPRFVERHRQLAEPGYFVAGDRALLKRKTTECILTRQLRPERWSVLTWAGLRLRGRVNRISPMISLPVWRARQQTLRRRGRFQTHNLGVWRGDLDLIDGFDESYVGWGYEDDDLGARLLHAGVRPKDGRLATGVLHLWHESAFAAANRLLFNETLKQRRTRAVIGLSTADAVTRK